MCAILCSQGKQSNVTEKQRLFLEDLEDEDDEIKTAVVDNESSADYEKEEPYEQQKVV